MPLKIKADNAANPFLIGRQPILDRNEGVVAYELLFRSAGSRENAAVRDDSYATSHVILNSMSGFGLVHILGHHRGFINVELDLLMSDAIELLPREKIVLELLETLQISPEVVRRCRELNDKGYAIAIDDHQFDVRYAELYEIAEIVKIDLFQSPLETLPGMVEKFRHYPVKLLAEKVETRESFLRCRDLGFEYFQGYHFARPTVLEKKRIDESSAALLRLVHLLAENAGIEEIENTIRRSPGLAYKLLLLVNSVSFGPREQISSIRHALTMLGRRQIGQWAQLSLFVADGTPGVLNPLMEMAAVRAGFMEQLTLRHRYFTGDAKLAEQAFLVGILSLLENIYDVTVHDIVSVLNLSAEVIGALVAREGFLGSLLKIAELLDSTYCRVGAEQLEALGVTHEEVLQAQISAYQWLGAARF